MQNTSHNWKLDLLNNINCNLTFGNHQACCQVSYRIKKAISRIMMCSLTADCPLFTRTSYSFTLPAEMLLMIYFEQKQNTTMMGMTEIATARYTAP